MEHYRKLLWDFAQASRLTVGEIIDYVQQLPCSMQKAYDFYMAFARFPSWDECKYLNYISVNLLHSLLNAHSVSAEIILSAMSAHPDSVSFTEQDLRMEFGFVRKSAEEIMWAKLIASQATEESIQSLSLIEMEKRIQDWCRQNSIVCRYDWENRRYTFQYWKK